MSPSTDTADALTADATGVSAQTTAEEKTAAEKETPKADEDKDASVAKNDTSATADKPDDPTPKSPKHDTAKADNDSPKHESKKADNESGSEGAQDK